MKVVAYTKYDREAASTRQRLLQYLPALRNAGIDVEYWPLLDDAYVQSIAGKGRPSPLAIFKAYAVRLRQLLRRTDADLIWVYAELFPWLPRSFEALIRKQKAPVVYDFDDAFFVPYDEHRRRPIRWLLSDKLRPLISRAAACTCGNAYLQEYAARWCDRAIVVPTVVDTDRYVPSGARKGPVVIGWIGSPTTWANVRPLLPLFKRLCETKGVIVRAVGAGKAASKDAFPGLELVDWREDDEIQQVQGFDIGIMPLIDAPFQRGKSGYKLIQYMACGLPTVASPVGVNSVIVRPGETGFLASNEREWDAAITTLIDQPDLRKTLGGAGRERAVADYSLASQSPRLIALFRSLAG